MAAPTSAAAAAPFTAPAAPTAPAPESDDARKLAARLQGIAHVVLILSGKGGVGKSTVTAQLARALVAAGKRVGVLDTDLCGPSMPHLLGVADKPVHQCSDGWVPIYVDNEQRLSVMSIGFLLQSRSAFRPCCSGVSMCALIIDQASTTTATAFVRPVEYILIALFPDPLLFFPLFVLVHSTDAVVWRGPKKTAMIQQFLADVCWGELDYLLIDTPPGTSDEHLTIVDCLRCQQPDGAILVTTPQGMSLQDVMREATFCRRTALPLLGLIENMSGFVCPHCAVWKHCIPSLWFTPCIVAAADAG